MHSYDVILAAGIFLVLFLLSVLMCGDTIGMLIAWIGNPILRKLGLQGDHDPNKDFSGRFAQVLSNDKTDIRVQLDGTSWKALSDDINWIPAVGESVLVKGINGITLLIKKGDNQVDEQDSH
jgi:membrane protein implicated in regulation of membrane protease activity